MAAPTVYMRSSAPAGAMTCRPAGRPSSAASPIGSPNAQLPARFTGMVAMSLRYMASGSSSLSPSGKAVVGAVGESRTSHCSNAASKSRWMRVRTFWALP